jgi:hypothetical protein
MARRRRLIGASVAAVAVVALGAGLTWSILRRRRQAGAQDADAESPAQQATAAEPPGGYVARWDQRARDAIRTCRRDDEVDTWPQAVACALNVAYPEAAPWTDPESGSRWMAEAAAHVESELARAVRPDRPMSGWEAMVWLRADREAALCIATYGQMPPDDLARCVASAIYPNVSWIRPDPGWTQDMLGALRDRFGLGRSIA